MGELLEVPFARPRVRSEVLAHDQYYELRGAMIGFLEEQEHDGPRPSLIQKTADFEVLVQVAP